MPLHSWKRALSVLHCEAGCGFDESGHNDALPLRKPMTVDLLMHLSS